MPLLHWPGPVKAQGLGGLPCMCAGVRVGQPLLLRILAGDDICHAGNFSEYAGGISAG